MTFAEGASTPPTSVTASGGAQTNGLVTDPIYPVDEDGSDAPGVAAAISGDDGATLKGTFDDAGGFYCQMGEAQARAIGHDARVAYVLPSRGGGAMRPFGTATPSQGKFHA